MANYFVSATRGSDSNNGTSPSTPWLTIGKAIGASPAITLSGTGDTLWVEPGVYREMVALGLSPTSGGPLSILADNDGAGFAAGGYSTPVTGRTVWTGWSSNTTVGTTQETLTASGKSYVTLGGFKIIGTNSGSTPACLNVSGTWSNWTITECTFVSSAQKAYLAWFAGAAGAALNLTIQRCTFLTSGAGFCIDIRMPLHSAEYGMNAIIRNCRFFNGTGAVRLAQVGGSGSFYATGLTVQSCFAWGTSGAAYSIAYGAGVALTNPSFLYGSSAYNCNTGVSAGQTTQLTENGNILYAVTTRSGVSAGANSAATAEPDFDFDDALPSGGAWRPIGTPAVGSLAAAYGSYGTPASIDLTGRARPEGYGSTSPSLGPLELHDNGTKDVTYKDAGSAACLKLTGPASQDRPILVDAQSTTITVKVRWDGNHADTNKPQAQLLANAEIGFAGETKTATSTGGSGSTPNSYETLTFTGFTPSAKGVVMLRMISRSAAGNGAAYFDTITVS